MNVSSTLPSFPTLVNVIKLIVHSDLVVKVWSVWPLKDNVK